MFRNGFFQREKIFHRPVVLLPPEGHFAERVVRHRDAFGGLPEECFGIDRISVAVIQRCETVCSVRRQRIAFGAFEEAGCRLPVVPGDTLGVHVHFSEPEIRLGIVLCRAFEPLERLGVIHRGAFSLLIHFPEHQICRMPGGLRRLPEPCQRLGIGLRDPEPLIICHGGQIHAGGNSVFRGFPVPLEGHGPVLSHDIAFRVQMAEVCHGFGIALFCGIAEKTHSFRRVPVHAVAAFQKDRRDKHGGVGKPALRGPLRPFHCKTEIALWIFPVPVVQTKGELCGGIAVLRFRLALFHIAQIRNNLCADAFPCCGLSCPPDLKFRDEFFQPGDFFRFGFPAFQDLVEFCGLDFIGARSLFIAAVHQLFRLIHQVWIGIRSRDSERKQQNGKNNAILHKTHLLQKKIYIPNFNLQIYRKNQRQKILNGLFRSMEQK